jgi:peptidoglycan/xylan/chitin deacetylase (PgdA/CDA1 family)
MSRDQVTIMAAQGIDFQMHTHQHRLPADEGGFAEAIGSNRSRIRSLLGYEPRHLAYPNGATNAAYSRLLQEHHIETAVTANPGLVSPASDRHKLPRYLDSEFVPDIVFRSWVTGVISFVAGSTNSSWTSIRESVMHRRAF